MHHEHEAIMAFASATGRLMAGLDRALMMRRAFVCSASLVLAVASLGSAQGLPARLSDQQFWALVTESSEPGGFFQSDNLVSNETTMQVIIPELLKAGRAPGGVYIGVGPDQNFTYIAAMRPRMAFIVDIRREAVMQHLMYKALFEMARDRAQFLSLLLARPQPEGIGPASMPDQLVDAYYTAQPDTALYFRTLRSIEQRLMRDRGFTLDHDDWVAIEYVYTSFHLEGLDITYSFGQGFGGMRAGRGMPSLADLIVATDALGTNRGFLATEEAYATVRQMHLNNLIVPVVGDFAGPRAVRAIGAYVARHGATVSAIYTSNVEQYLFRDEKWRRYYDNVATLPLDSASTFVRAVFNTGGGRSLAGFGGRSITLLQPVQELVRAVREGRIKTYLDVIGMSRPAWQP
jgi:hypothetical protein